MAIDKVKSPVAAEGGKSSAFAEGLPKAANIKFPSSIPWCLHYPAA